MGTLLASRIKQRRKELKLSQKELAEGICKQGQISRLENGEYSPGSELLHELAKKLQVSMDYFFDKQVNGEMTELYDFKKLAKSFLSYRDYESLKYIYELEKETSHRLSLSDKIYMEWIGTLVDFYYFDKKKEAMTRLEDVLNQLKRIDLMYLQISNTLFNFYYDSRELERFKLFEKDLVNKISALNVTTLEELELYIKFHYNLGRYLWLNKDTEQAISEITKTIQFCKDYRTTYQLADLYLLLGNISKSISNEEVVKGYFEMAQALYKLDNNTKMSLTVDHYIAEYFTK